jgi:proteic killer suppression protein
MIRPFKHKGLEKFFMTGKTTGIRSENAKRLRLILGRLSASQVPSDMTLPGLRLHPLKGDMKNLFAVNVSGHWRVIFRFDSQEVFDVDYVDYH